jgi:hypothetical protein
MLATEMTKKKQTFLLFTTLYLMSFAVLLGWVTLLLIGLLTPSVMGFANRIAVATLLGSVLCLGIFKRLARRAERNLS